MYCQKCNRLLSDDNLKCTKCGFDNSIMPKSVKLKENAPEDKKVKKPIVLIGVCILIVLSYIITVIIMHNSKVEELEFDVVTKEIVLDKTFTFNGITISYPDNWGSSKTVIFNRESPKLNINFKDITENEYNELTSINECLNHSFNGFSGLTYADENQYTYLFILDNLYYKITVNYEKASYTSEMQNEVSQIISSIEQKK